MSAPEDVTRQPTSVTATNNTWTLQLPTVASGDFMLAFIRASSSQNIIGGDVGTNWTQLASSGADASDDFTEIWAKQSDGTEGASDTIGWSGSVKGGAIVYKITGADSIANWQATSEVFTTANFNPANINFGSVKDWLLCLCIGCDGETQTFSAPSTYATATQTDSGTGGAVASNCRLAATSKGLTAVSSEDPGAWSHGIAPNSGGTHYAIAIPAPPAATPGPVWPRKLGNRFLVKR